MDNKCPECGSDQTVEMVGDDTTVLVVCLDCGHYVLSRITIEEGRIDWNKMFEPWKRNI